jgi:hypothetical protein
MPNYNKHRILRNEIIANGEVVMCVDGQGRAAITYYRQLKNDPQTKTLTFTRNGLPYLSYAKSSN